jgi:hypothetical protein
MGDLNPWWVGGGFVVVLWGVWRFWRFCHAVQVERARELFRLQHERFEEDLLKAAAATGKPRDLRWQSCTFTGEAILTRDTTTRGITAFVPVEVMFEPVEGGDLEDVPAARLPRPATAIFTFARGHWHTDGRIVFNLSPAQAIDQFGKRFTLLG